MSNSITSYFMKVMKIHDKLALVGEKVVDVELLNMALNRFPTSWEPFVKCICARENLPNFEDRGMILLRRRHESNGNKKGGDENLALFGQTNKGKGKGTSNGK
jgi:hypothetical protein